MATRPKYVHAYRSRGKVYYYFRRGSVRVRLPGTPSTAPFWEAYTALLGEHRPISRGAPKRPPAGSIGALVTLFQASPEWARLAPSSRVSYQASFRRLDALLELQASRLERRHVLRLRDKVAATAPATADMLVDHIKRLWNFAIDRDFPGVAVNAAARVQRIHRGQSHERWTDEHHAAFEASDLPPVGVRTAYMLGTYTGQRLGDCLAMRADQYDGIGIDMGAQVKTGSVLWIPVHRTLKLHLDALPRPRTFLAETRAGQPYGAKSFTSHFRRLLDRIGLQGLSFHGLRHSTGARLAEAGCTTTEIQAILGHLRSATTEIYTRKADQRRRALEAMRKLEGRRG